jgi:exonuclease III
MLLELCNNLELFDPYRTLHPNIIDYTYIPSDPLKKNRSRINFFLASKCLAKRVTECLISNSLQNRLFDHKAVSLSFLK